MGDRNEWEEEKDVLQSIYDGDEIEILPGDRIKITLRGVEMYFSYDGESRVLQDVRGKKGRDMIHRIRSKYPHACGSVFDCVTDIQDMMEQYEEKEEEEEEEGELPDIIWGDTYIEKKSKFQGYVARVEEENQVERIRRKLMEDKKISNATHLMYAYRISKDRCGKEDDGEGGAGDVLLELLERKNMNKICVFVSRWYGGIKLGGLRFRVIAKTANGVLQSLKP